MVTGRPRRDDRVVLNGIVWKLRTGSAWRDVPETYGSWRTLYTRFRRWALVGTFTRMLEAVQAQKDAAGDVDWLVSVDSTITRAHQHAAGARKRGWSRRNGTRSRFRTIPWRTDDQDSPRLRRPWPSARFCRHRRQHQRLHAVGAGPRADQGSPSRPRPMRTRHDHLLGDRGTAAEAYATTCGNAVSRTPSLNGRTGR